MRKNTKNKVLSLLLALAMVLGLSPGITWAAGSTVTDYFEGFPLTADPGTGTTLWTVSGDTLKSGNKGKAYSSSTLKLTFTEDTQISFEYKVSCEEKYDFFTINNGEKESGALDWQTFSKEVRKGETLTAVYKKDGSGDGNDDCVYLRNFSCGEGVTITFHNGEETVSQTIYGGKGLLKANTFTSDHAVFAGWATEENGTVVYTDGASIEATKAINLFAVWADAWVVTFEDNGKPVAQNVIRGGTLDSLPKASGKTGYTFDGWFSEEVQLTVDTPITDDVTYTAKYHPITYTVKFNANGGTGTMADITAVYDKAVTLPENSFIREGYHFLGWGKYSSSKSYSAGETATNLQSKQDAVQTLYAIWAGNPVPVTIHYNDGTSKTDKRTCVVGESYNYISTESGKQFSSLPDPKREGYNFKGWFTEAEGGAQITNQYKFTGTDPVTLYAHWARAVTVTFDANGGNCYTTSKVIDEGSGCTLPNATLSGKKFLGWFTDLEGGKQVDNATVFTEDATLYARYRSYQIVISFDANGGEGIMEPFAISSGTPAPLPQCAFTPPEGQHFAKWTTIKAPSSWQSPTYYDDGAEYSWTSSYSDSTAALYAVWEDGEPEQPSPEVPDHPTQELESARDALGQWYKPYPIFGTDTNVADMVQADLVEKGFADISVSVKTVTATNGTESSTSNIAENGDISYFYADPNGMRGQWLGSYQVDFILTKGEGRLTLEKIPVTVYWDVERVKGVMRDEILNRVTLDTAAPVTENLSLPRAVDGKTWTLISWQSSDEDVISISDKNQSTADTLFDPYVGEVKRGQTDQQVTLTATFTFQRVNDTNSGREKPIVLYKTFPVTVKALDASQEEQIRANLLAKLDAGFEKSGLTDAATRERLAPDANGVYTAANDIQIPTTRDFGVDGKYYPATITTSNGEVLKAPDVNNAARVEVYRPGPSQENTEGAITVTLHDRDTSVTASRTFRVKVPALTQEEVQAELDLMEKVKGHYFDGLKGSNTAKDNVRTDLTPFFEVYEQNGELIWVRTNAERTGQGIVPVPIEGWEDLELWRLFKSSNPNVISHENLIVTRQAEAKAVTITSRLSSETLGRYGALYLSDPYRYAQYAGLDKLYYQEVTTSATAQPEARRMARAAQVQGDMIVVRGTRDPESAIPVTEVLNNVSFSLIGLDGTVWIAPTTLSNLDESSTVYDVFTRMLTDNGCTATRVKGTYIKAISGPHGALAEKEYGDDSGWMYRVNGRIPNVYMGACPLHSGDTIQVFYTRDAKKDDPNYSRPSGGNSSGGSSSGGNSSSGGKTEQPNRQTVKVEASGHGDTYTVTLPKDSKGPQLVTIPNVKQGQLVVVVHADGREEIIKKAILEEGRAKFLLEQNASVKVVDYANPFGDVSSSAWYASAVDFAAGRGLFAGVGQNTFAPNLPLSRGMLASVLCRLEDAGTQKTESVFTDVAEGAWYEQGIAWAAETGIVSGYGGGRFGPNDEITREQLAVMLFRYAQLLNMSTGGRDSLTGFSDTASVSPWAQDAVAWAVDSGIISGLPDGTLSPTGTATRAEAAAMLQQFVSVLLK